LSTTVVLQASVDGLYIAEEHFFALNRLSNNIRSTELSHAEGRRRRRRRRRKKPLSGLVPLYSRGYPSSASSYLFLSISRINKITK
jgi:hypothetical protein